MDTIAQGNTQTYIMDDGNSLDLLTKGVASYAFIPFGVAANETTGQVLSTQGVTKLGPFWVQTTVKITATNGACQVAAMIEKADCLSQCDDIVRAVIDPVTGGSVLFTPESTLKLPAGETDLTAGMGSVKPALVKPQIKVSWLGNSVIANGGDAMGRHLTKLSGGQFVTIKNGGVAGQGSAALLSSIAGNIDPAADLVIMMEGSNDATSNIGCSAHYNNMRAAAQYCIDNGQVPMILASPPRDLAGTTVNKRTMKYPLTDWLAARDVGGIYCDPWRDFRSVAGEWPSGYTTSNDNTHPAFNDIYNAAAARIWQAIQNWAVGQIPVIEPFSDDENAGYTSVSNVGSTSLVAGNALLQDGTAGWQVVDSANPTNVVTDANVALSTASAAPYRGNELTIDFTAGISAGRGIKRRFIVNNSTSRPAATDELIVCAVIGASGLSNAKVTAYSYAPNGGWANKSLFATRRLDFEREFFATAPFVAGGSGTAQEYSIVVEITQVNTSLPATGTVAVSNADMYNLTRLKTTNFGV